jgi:hypothetical protein
MKLFTENKALSFPQTFGLLMTAFGLPISAVAVAISEPKAAMINFMLGVVGLGIAAIDASLKNAPKNTYN